MTNSSRRGKIDPIWWAPVLLVVVIAISTLTALLFSGTLRSYVPLTLVSDRSGLVMENGAKVKLRGVQIGEVTSIGAETGAAGDRVEAETEDLSRDRSSTCRAMSRRRSSPAPHSAPSTST